MVSEHPEQVACAPEGALELARQLWELADQWEQASARRWQAALAALAAWTGPAAEEVEQRARAELRVARDLGHNLRQEARQWAQSWADAMNDRNHRAGGDAASAGAGGLPAPPVPTPVGPGFEPTTGLGGLGQ